MDEERRTLGGDPDVPGRVRVADSFLEQELTSATTQVGGDDDGDRWCRPAQLFGEDAYGAWLHAVFDLEANLDGLAIGRPETKGSVSLPAPLADALRSDLVETPG